MSDYLHGTALAIVVRDIIMSHISNNVHDTSAQPEPEHTMEEFMYGQELGDPEDGSL